VATVGGHEFAVGLRQLLGGDHGLRATSQQLRPVGAEPSCQPVKLSNQLVVKLNEHFASRHEHMLSHMSSATLPSIPSAPRLAAIRCARGRVNRAAARRCTTSTPCRTAMTASAITSVGGSVDRRPPTAVTTTTSTFGRARWVRPLHRRRARRRRHNCVALAHRHADIDHAIAACAASPALLVPVDGQPIG